MGTPRDGAPAGSVAGNPGPAVVEVEAEGVEPDAGGTAWPPGDRAGNAPVEVTAGKVVLVGTGRPVVTVA